MTTISVARFAVLPGLILLAACSGTTHGVVPDGPSQALAATVAYADQHYRRSDFQHGSAYLSYNVEDHGDIWITSISSQGYIGGGVRMIVRKSDMAVVDAQRTQ